MEDRKPKYGLLNGARNWLTSLGRGTDAAGTDGDPESRQAYVAYAVGDIHGRLDLLLDLEARIRDDVGTRDGLPTLLVYLGDYIDRGRESRGVIEHLSQRPKLCGTEVFLRGNHEQVLLDFLCGANILDAWCRFGGLDTLASYGLEPKIRASLEQREELRVQLRSAMPPHHADFLAATRPSFETADYFFVHAGINPKVSLAQQSESDLLWIRDKFLNSSVRLEKRIIHGHTPAERPEILPHRINVDTGAYHTGQLSCAVLEGSSCRILSTAPEFA